MSDSVLGVPGLDAGVIAHGIVNAIQLRKWVENGRRDVIQDAALEPVRDHVEFDVDDVRCRPDEERAVSDLLLDVCSPEGDG